VSFVFIKVLENGSAFVFISALTLSPWQAIVKKGVITDSKLPRIFHVSLYACTISQSVCFSIFSSILMSGFTCQSRNGNFFPRCAN
jgi:hypothetical protein